MSVKSKSYLKAVEAGTRRPICEWQGFLDDTFTAVVTACYEELSDDRARDDHSSDYPSAAVYCWQLFTGADGTGTAHVKIGISEHPMVRMASQLKNMPPTFRGLMLGYTFPKLDRGGVEIIEAEILCTCREYLHQTDSEWLVLPQPEVGDWEAYWDIVKSGTGIKTVSSKRKSGYRFRQ